MFAQPHLTFTKLKEVKNDGCKKEEKFSALVDGDFMMSGRSILL
jgi:hypothetical protein